MVGSNPLLSILDLSGIRMGDKGLEQLVNGMKVYKSLISLNLNDNNLSSDSLTSLGDYLASHSLIELRLSGNDKIGNKGMKFLAKSL